MDEVIQIIRKSHDSFKEISKLLEQGPSDYYFDKLEIMQRMLFDRFSPYKVGDRVRLTRTPEITEEKSWGWLGSKHFLIEGATAVVREIDIRKYKSDDSGKFVYGLHFDNESWVDKDGQINMIADDRRALYTFGEDWLERAD